MPLVFLASLILAGEKPQVTAAMNAERRLAAAFSEGLFDAHRKLLSPGFRFQPEGGGEAVGRTEFIENLTQYRNAFVTGKETVRLVKGAVRGNLVDIRVSIDQVVTYRENGRVLRSDSNFQFDDVWERTPIGYRLLTMKPVPKVVPVKKAPGKAGKGLKDRVGGSR